MFAALTQPGTAAPQAFPATSRYAATPTAKIVTPEGRTVVYLRRRFAPPPESLAPLLEHSVSQGDRLDILAAQYLGDPEQFWRLCDANNALDPDELTEGPGRVLVITLPAGLPAPAAPYA